MRIIDSADAPAGAPLTPRVRRLLTLRSEQLGGHIWEAARFVVVEPGDGIADVEGALAFPIIDDGEPTFEWAARHEGLFELTFVLSDDGPADVLLVPDDDGVDPTLIALCRLHAIKHAAP